MRYISRPAPFVLTSSDHGTLIVNRNDYCALPAGHAFGVGHEILNCGSHSAWEIELLLWLLGERRRHVGDGCFAIDCGANIGVHTVEWARYLHGWGNVLAFEPQEKIFYALAGNIIINNCLNAVAKHVAVGGASCRIRIPVPDYLSAASYGSLELRPSDRNEFIGQTIDYADRLADVDQISLDSLELPRLDLLKVDVEGMEEDVFAGGADTIKRLAPIILVEVVKSDKSSLTRFLLECGYTLFPAGMNLLAVHQQDATLEAFGQSGWPAHLQRLSE